MYYFLTASKDASIFQQQPTQNTGLDEVLEVSKVYYGSLKDIAISLIKFDLNTLSQSWEMGIGTRFDDISSEGCTWNYRASGSDWLPTNVPNSGSATGSFNGKGGMWYTASQATRNYDYESSDLIVDVSSSLSFWIDGGYSNEDLLLNIVQKKKIMILIMVN